MTDDERHTRQPLSMTRRYRRGLILTGLLCALAVLTAATVLFQRSYAERIDNYLMQICHGYAAAYEAQDTHSATTLLNLLPENCPLRITLIDTDGTVLYDTKRGSYIVDVNGDIYAAQTDLPNHADRPEFQQAMANGSARASPARARRCSWRRTTTPCASTCRRAHRCCAWARTSQTSGA